MNEQMKDVALGLMLTEWNDEQTIEEIFSEDNEETIRWEPYEDFTPETLKEIYESTLSNLLWAYNQGAEGGKRMRYTKEDANLTHKTQIEKFGFCICEEEIQFPYDDCPTFCDECGIIHDEEDEAMTIKEDGVPL